MLFRRLILSAVGIGLIVGLLAGIGEQFSTAPLIAAAEHYEQPHHHHAHAADSHGHAHDDGAWAPGDGAERIVFTVIASIGVAIGFALLLLVAMSTARMAHGTPMSAGHGILWGMAAYLTVFVVPALGLPPEVPGTAAAALTDRQTWWIATALVTAIALWAACLSPRRYRVIALALIGLPFIIGAPEPATAPYAGHDPAATAALEAISHRFIIATSALNLVQWLVIGALGGLAMQRGIVPAIERAAPRASASAQR
ncbi:CbtA family protein [Salinisphaera sp. Q1T1-3]|uniref:CbtA family protein n=1 Tax=Salinisphaera sp. Q1T1-3 TaxID=2321229 RepID=UPI000E723676|nr:CbtA family protein [Salinisphaera sp. Q1T1-3]RJS95118.1 hypothetical protein D3260_00735 [Salinisphaera sp. Q1T1-3]